MVGLVGPCAAGKSTLARALRQRGVRAREIAQEHSYVPTMWQRITHPDWLILLDVSAEEAGRRRKRVFSAAEWETLTERLCLARAQADLVIDTDGLTPDEVLQRVLDFLTATESHGTTRKACG